MKNILENFDIFVSKYTSELGESNHINEQIKKFTDVFKFVGQIDKEVCYYILNLKTLLHEFISDSPLFFENPNDLSLHSFFDLIHPNDQSLYASILREVIEHNSRLTQEERENFSLEYSLRIRLRTKRYVYINETVRMFAFDENGQGLAIIGLIRLSPENTFKAPILRNLKDNSTRPIFNDQNKYKTDLGIIEELTNKEINLIALFMKYPTHTQSQIAVLLNVHENTVKNYIKNLKRKLSANSLDEMINKLHIGGYSFNEPDFTILNQE